MASLVYEGKIFSLKMQSGISNIFHCKFSNRSVVRASFNFMLVALAGLPLCELEHMSISQHFVYRESLVDRFSI